MSEPADLSPAIVEALYCEALVLADEARAAFDPSSGLTAFGEDEDLVRIALSCEALRTTTRMMHAIAWLLNQRAYFSGELSELQLRRHGRLPAGNGQPDPGQLALLPPLVQDLIERTRHFHERIERLDRGWQAQLDAPPPMVHALQARLGRSVANL